MAGAAGEFVEGWLVAQVLGEGAYGEVRLLVHARTGARVALKAAGGEGLREAALHRALRHRHVLRCLGARAHRGLHYLFLEYAPGGELFERIEPDAGMAPAAARRYWRQLAHGLRYLHARGVAHRDIKPENLLLDARDDIKISDFGLATLFRHGARERRLARVCGTLPYAAPEVHGAPARPYRAPPADAWAAAVVLLAMLVGELPWERAHPEEPRYAAWARWVEAGAGAGAGGGALPGGVWARAGGALAWLARALHPSPARRAPLADLLLDAWMHDAPPPNAPPLLIVSRPLVSPGATGSHSKNACRIKMNCTRKRRRDQERARAPSQASQPLVSSSRYTTINKSGRDPPRNRRRTALFIELLRRLRRQANFTKPAGSRGCLSQPAGAGAGGAGAGVEEDGELAAAAMEAMLSASQPAAADDLLLSTQLAPLAGSDALEAEGVCGVARRLARVWVCGAETEALRCVAAALERLRCAVRRVDARTLAADCHPGALRAHVAATRRGASLVHFRRWRGCGLRFQRLFLSLRAELAPALAPAPPPPPDPPLRAPAPMEEDT